MLIVTLPPPHQEEVLRSIISHPAVDAVRYNTGADSPYTPKETLQRVLKLAEHYKKPLYVDLKGRQLRIMEWAVFPYGPIVLNHKVKVDLPAKVFFRGDDACDLKEVIDGNKLYVDPFPKFPVGRGQSINIISRDLKIEGYLIENDREYAIAARELGINKFMLSFVESLDDAIEFEELMKSYLALEIVLKIESQKGLDFVKSTKAKVFNYYQLMAARDDLMIQIGALNMPDALKLIVEKDENAICASRLLLGLETGGEVSMADISDLRLMEEMGYKRFMLSDGLSRKHAKEALKFWEEYRKKYPLR